MAKVKDNGYQLNLTQEELDLLFVLLANTVRAPRELYDELEEHSSITTHESGYMVKYRVSGMGNGLALKFREGNNISIDANIAIRVPALTSKTEKE